MSGEKRRFDQFFSAQDAWLNTGREATDALRVGGRPSGRLSGGYAVVRLNHDGIDEIRAVFGPGECAEAAYCLRVFREEAQRQQLISAQADAAYECLPEPRDIADHFIIRGQIEQELGDVGPFGHVFEYPDDWRLLRVTNGAADRLLDEAVIDHERELTREERARLENEWRRNAAEKHFLLTTTRRKQRGGSD